jgi:secretin/TonB-like protein
MYFQYERGPEPAVRVAYVPRDACGWCCFMVICLAWTLQGRAAQQEAQAIEVELRIAAQPLDEALQEFARQSGMQVIYLSSLTEGIQSPGVNGRHTVAEAHEALLAGSGLSFHMLDSRTVAIRKANGGELSGAQSN